jgi:DsbC/DsbD-like thiol-disulfide interchange protein
VNKGLLSALLIATGVVVGTSSTARANPHAEVSLLSETDQPRPGSTILLGIRIAPTPGWHSYWSNPGDSGIAPTIQWKAMPGVRFGPLLHPAPTLLKVAGITSYVHSGEHILLARVRADPTLKRGTLLPIKARLTWATCSESLCVPERTTLSLNLRVGDGVGNASASGLRLAVQRLPRQLAEGVFRTRGGLIRMEVPKAANVDSLRAIFFPDSNDAVAAATLRLRIDRGKTEIVGRKIGSTPLRINGVLSDGKKSYALSFRKAK